MISTDLEHYRKLAERFKVSLTFIRNFLKRYRDTQEIAPKPQVGDQRSKVKGKDLEILREIVSKQNDIYLRACLRKKALANYNL
jgi:transposase